MLELKRSKRWSILPALTVDGYLDWTIVQGSITTVSYIQFVRERVLPHCNTLANGLERSVLVMDNAKIHHSPEMLEMCAAAGVQVEFLPPYSPDLNPIETSFALLKAYLRRHTDEAQLWASSDMFGEFLDNAVKCQMSIYDARRLYSKSGIRDNKSGYCIGDISNSNDSNDSEIE